MTNGIPRDECLVICKRELDRGLVLHHPFLLRFEEETLSKRQLRRFAIQWPKVARAHRHAFPGLILNITDEELRVDLVGILWEEYGDGDAHRIHAKLLDRFVSSLGVSAAKADRTRPLPAVRRFAQAVALTWSKGDHARAFGLQFGLEYLASSMQRHFARGLEKYQFLSAHDREYFDLHAEAEIRHIRASENGFLHFARTSRGLNGLQRGVALAQRLLDALWKDFEEHIFGRAFARRRARGRMRFGASATETSPRVRHRAG